MPINYSCTTTDGCSATTLTTNIYSSLGACQLACIGWGCSPSPDLAPDADILFVFDFSGSFPNPSIYDYFKATTAWTQTLVSNGWVGDANWLGSMDFESPNGQEITFTANDGTPVSIGPGTEEWLSWGSIPYWATNLKANGTKDFVTGGPDHAYLPCPSSGWLYCPSLPGGNPPWTVAQQNVLDQHFTHYTIRENIASTGFTYPTNDQLVITITEYNMGYDIYNWHLGDPGSRFKNEYRLWDKVWSDKPADLNIEAWAIPATYSQPVLPTEDSNSRMMQRGEAAAARLMLASIDDGNQDDLSIGGTGTLNGTWVIIPNGGTNLDGSPCTNVNGCSTIPGGEGSANPCIYNGNDGSPAYPAPNGAYDMSQPYSPCYTDDYSWNGTTYTNYTGAVNAIWSTWGRLGTKGWSHRAWDNTLNNPQTDLIALLDNEVIPNGAANWVPYDCFSAETDYNLDITYPYSSYDGCTAGTESCVFNWYCDGLGTPCYEAFGTLSDPGMYATELACQAACNTTIIYWSCETEGCSSGFTVTQWQGATGLTACQEDCVGWGCVDVATLTDFYLYVYYDLTSMGVENIKLSYSAATAWVDSLVVPPNDVFHVIMGDEEWLRWGAVPFMTGPELNALGQSAWGATQAARIQEVEDWWIAFAGTRVGTWYDNITAGTNNPVFPLPPTQTFDKSVLNLMFLDETHNNAANQMQGYFELSSPSTYAHPEYSDNTIAEPNTPYKADYNFYVSRYSAVTAATGSITNFIYPSIPAAANANPSKLIYTYTALHFVAAIDSGNQVIPDGTWMANTYPSCSIASLAELTQPNPYFDEVNVNPTVSQLSSNYGRLDHFGWGYNVNFSTMNGVVLTNDLNNFIANSPIVTTTTVLSICTSAETNYLTHPTHSSATEALCWVDCEITGYTCTHNGCIYGIGPDFPYDTLADCHSGTTLLPACTSYECTSTGCTLYNEIGSSTYTGSGNLGTGGTNTTLNECLTLGCTSYDCTASGCTQYNISAGTPSYLNGSGGTAGTYTNSSCDDLCSSFDCTTTGCTDYNVSAGTASYALFDGSPMQGDGGTGGTYASTVICSGVCVSYECTDYGCVLYNDPAYDWAPGYTNGAFGSGGTFSSLNSCTAACQSFACETGGCEEWNTPSNTNAMSYNEADAAPYNLGGNYGTGGTSALTACTATCFTWECADDGCVSTVGFNLGAWQYDQETQCNQFCTSHNCTSSGCVVQPGSGGTFTGNTSQYDCENGTATLSACTHWNCDPLTPAPTKGPSWNDSYGTFPTIWDTGWETAMCTEHAGTGTSYNVLMDSAMAPFLTLEHCQSACTSWSCEFKNGYYGGPGALDFNFNPVGGSLPGYNPSTTPPIFPGMGAFKPDGCIQFPNTGNTWTHPTYDACTAATVCERYDCTDYGCVLGDPVTGTYPSYSACTGGTWHRDFNGPNTAPTGTWVYMEPCQSWECTATGASLTSGCEFFNGPNSSAINYIDGTYGTGGTNTTSLIDCDSKCVSYNCTATGCSEQLGHNGSYYDSNSPTNAAAMCQAACLSFVCLDAVPDGMGMTSPCVIYNSIPGTPGYANGFSGSGGTFETMYSCGTDCISWNCTDYGCESQLGTGGTFTTKALCTGSCQSWDCSLTGCTGWNDPLYPNSPNYDDGEYGTGGTETQSACTATCVSWNCTPNGCVVTAGTQGVYVDLPTCNVACSSWDCLSSGCTEYNISAGTPSYINGSGGTAGTYTNSSCDNECSSWDCTATGCTEYNVSAGTASYGLFNGTIYQGHGGSGGTYTGDSCDNFCYSYECPDIELTPSWGWNDDGCVQQDGTGSTFYSGIVSLAGVVDSYTACTAQCRSWSCLYPAALTDGCLEFPNTGNSQTFLSLDICTGDTQCWRWDCTDYGCVPGDHITGTYADYNVCEQECTSWMCEDDGCKIWNDAASGTLQVYPNNPGGGTGGTFTTSNCDDICQSYNCEVSNLYSFDACQLQVPAGSGGTFFNVAGVSYSLDDCHTGTTTISACTSWSCENPATPPYGCINYPNTGSTTQIMYDSYNACTAQTICDRYDCTSDGCVIGSQVTGDFGSFDECTGGTVANNYEDACQSWNCTATGTTSGVPCEVFNGPNSVGVTSTGANNFVTGPGYGTYGSAGASNSLANCNLDCKSWNCEDTGCNQQIGYSGAYDNDDCIAPGGISGICFSYECEPFYGFWDVDTCTQWPGSGSTFFNPGGWWLALLNCQSACTSWSCQNPDPAITTFGCEEYPNTGNTLTQPTYTACTAETVCWRYDCTANGCVVGSQTGGTYDSLDDCISGTTLLPACESWECMDNGCEEFNSISYPMSWHYIDGTRGTGGTNTIGLVDCDLNCRSYECMSYGCEDYGGTGHTYISTVAANEYSVWLNCVDNCKSWDCVDVGVNWAIEDGCQIYNQLIPPNTWTTPNGNNGFGTGGTYTSSTCNSACTSWRCIGMGTFGCTDFPNTASTYSTYTSCTANTECKHYDCTVSGCIEILSEYQGGIDSYETMSACTGSCVGWACIRDTISTGSSIYVYYDISNLSFGNIKNKRNELQNYINSNHPLFAGNIYHTIVSDGRWLDWANSIYSGEFSVAPGTGALPWEPTSYYDERALLGIRETSLLPNPGSLSGDWYDQYSAGTYANIGISSIALPGGNISSLTTNGIAPTANTSNNVVVISFISEADGVESPQGSVISNIHGYHDSTIPVPNAGYPIMLNQPMTEWKEDYTAYTENYNTVSGDSGTIRALLYPVRVPGTPQSDTIFNPQSTKMCLLQSFAAISSGNQTVSDGTWLFGTAPTSTGTLGGVPELCWTSLDQLESINPYWTTVTPTWGGLDLSGWTVNIQGAYLGGTNYTGFLDDYLVITTTGLTAGTCVSAETLYTANVAYSYSSETICDTGCTPTMYLCTTTGCTLSWDGYLTLVQCTNKCKSVSCTTVGCEYYNSPGSLTEINGYYGSGGTWTGGMGTGMMGDCQEVCISTNCNGYPSNLSQQGCIQQNGTGGTWTGINSFSACTGSCVSWTCDDPCQYLIPPYTLSSGGTGCVVWPNTGATHIELTACTATCQENYYCITGLTADTCSELIDTAIISPDIIDHIDAISTSTVPNWTNTLFDELKFILTNVVAPPTNACYDNTNNGYWVYITDIHVKIQIGTAIPSEWWFLDWNDLLGTMNGTASIPGVLVTPMTEISDIMNVPGITVTINQEFCLCTTSSCNVGCTNTSSLPANASGFYPTYSSAQTTCCPLTSWSCVTNTIIDNCDGLTLLPGIFLNPEACYNYMSVTPGWAGVNFTNIKCEISPTSVLAACEIGPNNGELVRLTGITTTIPAILSTVHTSWTGFTTALLALSTPVTIPPGLNTLVTWLITQLSYPGVVITYGWEDCECDNPYTCECVEIAGSGGTYTSQTLCEEVCCTASTWNCVQDQPYLPICQDKEYLGMAAGIGIYDISYYAVNSPSTIFGLDKWVIDGPLSPLFSAYTSTQVNDLMAGSGNGDYCFRHMGNNIWYAYWYIHSISHQLINTGAEYQTWNDFYNATDLIVTACTTSDSVYTIEDKINDYFGISAYTIDVNWKPCCNPSPCYCYDTFTTGGDYNSEILCDIACCPPDRELSWICTATTGGYNTCQFGYYGAPSLNSVNNTPGYGPWSSFTQCTELSYICATSWKCSVLTPPPLPCFGQPCYSVAGHYSLIPGLYPTEYSCNTNTDLDCCGPEALWICMSSETTTTMSGLTIVPSNAGTLGYHSSDEFLTYLADPTASPTRQYSAVTAFTFCKFETSVIVLNAAEESCKCGDGCDGIFHSTDYIVYNNLLTGSGSNGSPYHPTINPSGYCTTWSDMIAQLNTVWDITGTLNVTLNDTFNDVVTATTNVIGNVITISISGFESCVDTTGDCYCDPCFTPNCGMSKDDCEAVCCVPPPTTWTCTTNGCLDVCNGEGEYSSKTECMEICYEWGCMDDTWGCTDSGATNYNPLATIDDGTCVYPTNRWSCHDITLIDGCSDKVDTGGGGLSFTAAIYSITWNPVYHTAQLDSLKWSLGGGNNQIHQLPARPCTVPGQNWGANYAYIKYIMYSGLGNVQYTTWKSFIDAINALGYTFPYNCPPSNCGWQDLEAVLGASQLHCEWAWCDCGDGCNCVPDANGPYTSELGCDSDTNNCCESWNCETTYITNSCSGQTDIGFSTSVGWPQEPLEFMVDNGYQYTAVSTLKWIFNNPGPTGLCTINGNAQHWAHYSDITVGDSSLSIPNALVQTWDDAITWLNVNSGLALSPSMSYQSVQNILNTSTAYIKGNLGVCYCTGIECECVEVFDGSGLYRTSNDCATNPTSCCIPVVIPESYNCDCTGNNCAGAIDTGIVSTNAAQWLGIVFDWLSTNLITTTFSGFTAEVTGWTPMAGNCTGPNGGTIAYLNYISCNGFCADPAMNLLYYDFPTFISVANGLGIGISLGQTGVQMMAIITSHYSIAQGIYMASAYCLCEQITDDCNNVIALDSTTVPAIPWAGGTATLGGGPSISVMMYMMDPANGLQNILFTDRKFEIDPNHVACDPILYPGSDCCESPNGGYWSRPNSVYSMHCVNDPAIDAQLPMHHYSVAQWISDLTTLGVPGMSLSGGWGLNGAAYHAHCGTTGGGGIGFTSTGCTCTGGGCNCIDPGDGSGTYNSIHNCKNSTLSDCYTGTSSQACVAANCLGTVYIPDSNFENFLETHSGTTWTGLYGSNNAVATWPNTMGNGIIGDNLVSYSGICCVTQLNMDLQYISDLTGIENFNELTWINCSHNQLTTINVSSNLNLHSLHVTDNQLTTLDVSANNNLLNLSCQRNQLTTVNTNSNPNLYQFNCYSQQITSLDLSQNPLMKYLQCQSNQITSLDVSMLPSLRMLRCGYNQLTTIDVTNNPLLFDLQVPGNQLTTLDVSVHTLLTTLDYSNTQLTTQVDISNNLILANLSTASNPIGVLDVSAHSSLTRLNCMNNDLVTLDISNNLNLTYLQCGSNLFTTLDLSAHINLTEINCQSSTFGNLTTLILGSSINLNNITWFWVNANPNLTIHVGTAQRVIDFQNIFVAGTHYDIGINITI